MHPSPGAPPMTPEQLRCLQALWHRWRRRLTLGRVQDRALRHYYVWLFTAGRARITRDLTARDAAVVIRWLDRLVTRPGARQRMAAGTAGRHGYPERRRVAPNAAAWRVLRGYARALGMDRRRLERFIATHYAGARLRGLDDLRTMADLNRVLWGLKAMRRRGPRPGRPALKKVA